MAPRFHVLWWGAIGLLRPWRSAGVGSKPGENPAGAMARQVSVRRSRSPSTSPPTSEEPDKWFNHVEVIVAEKTGREPTTYVRNIYKYYVAYSLMIQAQEAQKTEREQVAPGKP